MMAAIHGCLSLLFVPFFLIAAFISFVARGSSNALPAVGILAIGILLAVILPFFYAAIGFLVGALGAWIYNLVARRIGGIKISLAGPPASAVIPPLPSSAT
jgi:hypothetical protein